MPARKKKTEPIVATSTPLPEYQPSAAAFAALQEENNILRARIVELEEKLRMA